MQMVLKATDQRGKVPWQETLVPKGNSDWKASMQLVVTAADLLAHIAA